MRDEPTTLTDDEIETVWKAGDAQPGALADTTDTGDDTTDTGDDTGDVSDTGDTGDDTGDTGDVTDA